jgi:hypothetical protein
VLRIRSHIARLPVRPHFHLLVSAARGEPERLRRTLASLEAQLYRDFRYVVLDRDGDWLDEFNASLAGAAAREWVMLLRSGDTLPAHALYWFANEARARPDAAILYSDDDSLDAEGRRSEPRFKPDWSPEHLRSIHYVGAAAVLRGDAVAAAGGVRPECCAHGNYDLLLRIIDSAGEKVAHVPAILFHRSGETPGWEDPRWCAEAVRSHLVRIDDEVPGSRAVDHVVEFEGVNRPNDGANGACGRFSLAIDTLL